MKKWHSNRNRLYMMYLPPCSRAPVSPQSALKWYYVSNHIVYLPEIMLYVESYYAFTTSSSSAFFSTVISEIILCISSCCIFAWNHIIHWIIWCIDHLVLGRLLLHSQLWNDIMYKIIWYICLQSYYILNYILCIYNIYFVYSSPCSRASSPPPSALKFYHVLNDIL